jgi:hypothetical protein
MFSDYFLLGRMSLHDGLITDGPFQTLQEALE